MGKMHQDVTETCPETAEHTVRKGQKIRSSKLQINALLCYMSANRQFAKGNLNKLANDEEWEFLAKSLNELGAVKTVHSWQTTWRDLKSRRMIEDKRKMTVNEYIKGSVPSYDEEDWSTEPTKTKSSAQPGSNATSSIFEPKLNSSNDKGPKKRSTTMQIYGLIEYMSSHPELAKNRFGASLSEIRRKKEEWQRLAAQLNKMGTTKTIAAWQTTWRDFIRKAKKEARELKKKAAVTTDEEDCGMENITDTRLSKYTRRILAIVKSSDEEDNDESQIKVDKWKSKVSVTQKILDIMKSSDEEESSEVIQTATTFESDKLPCLTDMAIPIARSLPPPSHLNSPDLDFETSCHIGPKSDVSMRLSSDEESLELLSDQVSLRRNSDHISNGQRNCDRVHVSNEQYDSKRMPRGQMSCGQVSDEASNNQNNSDQRFYGQRDHDQVHVSNEQYDSRRMPRGQMSCGQVSDEASNDQKSKQVLSRRRNSSSMSSLRYSSDQELSGRSSGEISNENPSQVSGPHSSSQIGQFKSGNISSTRDIKQASSVQRENERKLDGSFKPKTVRKIVTHACTRAQKAALVDYMSCHIGLARSKYVGLDTLDPRYAEWRQLTKYLNKMGPAKSTSGWRCTWQELIARSKRVKQNKGSERTFQKDLKIVTNTPSSEHNPAKKDTEATSDGEEGQTEIAQQSRKSDLIGKARCSKAQIAALMEYMAANPALATSQYTGPCADDPKIVGWRQLSRSLNRKGVARSTTGWQQIWRYIVTSVRQSQQSSELNAKMSRKVLQALGEKSIEKDNLELKIDFVDENGQTFLMHNIERESPVNFDQTSPMHNPDRVSPVNFDQTSSMHNPDGETPVNFDQTSPMHNTNRQSHVSFDQISLDSFGLMSPMHNTGQVSPLQYMDDTGQVSVNFGQTSPMNNNRQSPVKTGQMSPVKFGQMSPGHNNRQVKCGQADDCSGLKMARVRGSPSQIKAIVNYMSTHPSLATCQLRTLVAKKKKRLEWRRLSKLLNRMGPAKSCWKRTWVDLKRHAQKAKSSSGDQARIYRQVLSIMSSPKDGPTKSHIETIEVSSRMSPADIRNQMSPDNFGEMSPLHSTGRESPFELSQTRDFNGPVESKHVYNLPVYPRVSRAQLKALVGYMSTHPSLANYEQKTLVALEKRRLEWRRLGKHLNRMGPTKSTDAWKRCWHSLKRNAKIAKKLSGFHGQIYQQVLNIISSAKNGPTESHIGDIEESIQMSPDNFAEMSPVHETGRKSPDKLRQARDFERPVESEHVVDPPIYYKPQRTRLKRPSRAQVKALVSYMSTHPSMAKWDPKSLAAVKRLEWRRLGNHLNRMGPMKNTDAWKSCWQSLKRSARIAKNSSGDQAQIYQQVLNIISSAKDGPTESDIRTVENNDTLPMSHSTENISIPFARSPSPELCLDAPDPLQSDSEQSNDTSEDSEEDSQQMSVPLTSGQTNVFTRLQGSEKHSQLMSSVPHKSTSHTDSSNGSQQTVPGASDQSKNGQNSKENSQQIISISSDGQSNNVSTRHKDTGNHSQQMSLPHISGQSNNNQVSRHIERDSECNMDGSGQNRPVEASTRTRRQLNALVEFVYAHPALASDHEHSEWRTISKLLNKMGPIYCNEMTFWKNTWQELKDKVVRGWNENSCLDSARVKKVLELVAKYPTVDRTDPDIEIVDMPIEAPPLDPLSSAQHTIAEVLSRSHTADRGSTDDGSKDRIATSNEDSLTAGRDSTERSKEREEKASSATAYSNISSEDTNSLLKELIGELKRSNELKVEQNSILKQLVKQFNADDVKSSHNNKTEKQIDTVDTQPVVIQKREVEDLTEEYSANTRNSERSGEYSRAHFQERHEKDTFNVESGFPSETTGLAKIPQRPQIPVSVKGAISSPKKQIRTIDISRLMEPALLKPTVPVPRVIKVKTITKKVPTMPKVNLLRLKDGSVVLMPGTKLPASNDDYQTFIVGSVKHTDSDKVPQIENEPEGFGDYEF